MEIRETFPVTNSNAENEENYLDLLVSIEASEGQLSLLIGVCDDINYRKEIIARYEAELAPGIPTYQATLPRGEPSLRAALAQLVAEHEYLRQGGRAVLTVTGAEKLFFIRRNQERSEQEIFFGYLQWRREALRQFPYPVVLWVTQQILVKLSKKAPDFWSWRNGVFRFSSKKTAAISRRELEPIYKFLVSRKWFDSDEDDNPYFLPIEDLQHLIQQTEEQRGVKHPSLATLYPRVGQIYRRRLQRGESQDYQQEQALAIEYFRKAVDLQQELGLEEDLASNLNNLAELYYYQGRYNEAEHLYEQVIEINKRSLPEYHPDLAINLSNLAQLYSSQGRYSEAEPLYIQAIQINKRSLSEDHPYLANSLNKLAQLYYSQGRYSKAEPLYQQAIQINKRSLPEYHPYLANSLNKLAQLYYSQGRYSEAESLYIQAIQINKRSLPEYHPDLAINLSNLAQLYYSQRRYNEAEPLYIQAIQINKRSLPEYHPDLAINLSNLAQLYYSQGRYSEAEPLYIQAIQINKRSLPEYHPDLAINLSNLAQLYSSQGRYSEAESLYQQAITIDQRSLPEYHPNLATHLNNLAVLYESLGRYDKAEPLYQQALEIVKRSLSEDHPYLASSLNNLARLYYSQERDNEAEPLYQQAIEIDKRSLGMVDSLFFPNRLVPPNRFVGRTLDVKIAFDCISSRNPDYRGHLALWGGPGVGKSSFLNYLTDPQAWESYGEDPSQAIIVYLDCLDIRPFMPSNFWRQLLNLLQNKLEHSTNLRSEVNLLLEKAEVNPNDLEEILQKIGRQDQFLVLLLDNYDATLYSHEHYTETDLEYFLFDCRYLAYSSEQSRYLSIIVTSSRRLNEIGPKLTPGKSPWYNHYFFHLLKPFTDDEVAELLGSIPITPALKEGIREIADGNPTLLQNALYSLYSKLRLGQIPEPEAFTSELLSNNQQFFQQIWELSNELEQTLLMLIALSDLKDSLPNQNFNLGGIENILIQQENTLIKLKELGVIIDKVKDNKKIYSFASSLMEWWVIQKVYHSNEEEIKQREKAFLKIMSHRKVNKLTEAIRWLWQNREVPINLMEYSVRSVFSS
ncbi:MAG: tetratricopeptide repeat protein [Symploca sp. SIO2G7]|nr:tetratricopeptide repeat protein [Symploca sp. SIO2G7]